MTTLLLSHSDCLSHQTGAYHPESPLRLQAIDQAIDPGALNDLRQKKAPLANDEALLKAHSSAHLKAVLTHIPKENTDLSYMDPDTPVSPHSMQAARRAAGSAIAAVDAVMTGTAQNAFCSIRPPGHHATRDMAMGFCLFNNAAIAAFHARDVYNAQRIAVIDFDVHHGNGTQDIFWNEADFFYGSTHQGNFYPGTGEVTETGAYNNICNAPLRSGDAGEHFKAAMRERILPSLDQFAPDLIIISAGFDAHKDDPLGSLYFLEEDFRWATLNIADMAHKHTNGRMISLLEGGYNEAALASSALEHVKALLQAGS